MNDKYQLSKKFFQNAQQDIEEIFNRKSDLLKKRYTENTKNSHHKSNGNMQRRISLNFGRFVPNNIINDKQALYEENIKLRESLHQYKNEIMKLKTRLNVTQKQKDKIANECNQIRHQPANDMPIFRINNKKGNQCKNFSNSLSSLQILQNQSKYKKIIRENNDQIQQLQQQNNRLKKSIKYTQISQLNIQNERVMQENRRLNQILSTKRYDYSNNIQHYESIIQSIRYQLEQEKIKNRNCNVQLKKKNQYIEKIKIQLKQMSKSNRKIFGRAIGAKINNIQQQNSEEQNTMRIKTNEDIQIIKKCENLQIQLQKQKQKCKQLLEQNKILQKLKQKEVQVKKQNNKTEQYSEKYEQQQNQQTKPQLIQKVQTIQQNVEEKVAKKQKQIQYQQEIDLLYANSIENESEIIQQQQSKTRFRSYQQILKETIKYRMMSQKYGFDDLTQDINQSGVKSFHSGQISMILSDEPFYLNQEQLDYVMLYIFGQSQQDMEQRITSEEFLKKVKHFMEDFTELDQQKYNDIFSKCQSKIKNNLSTLNNMFANISQKQQTLSKKQLSKLFKQISLADQQIQLLLGQACLVSKDIENLNYNAFINKICPSQHKKNTKNV